MWFDNTTYAFALTIKLGNNLVFFTWTEYCKAYFGIIYATYLCKLHNNTILNDKLRLNKLYAFKLLQNKSPQYLSASTKFARWVMFLNFRLIKIMRLHLCKCVYCIICSFLDKKISFNLLIFLIFFYRICLKDWM